MITLQYYLQGLRVQCSKKLTELKKEQCKVVTMLKVIICCVSYYTLMIPIKFLGAIQYAYIGKI